MQVLQMSAAILFFSLCLPAAAGLVAGQEPVKNGETLVKPPPGATALDYATALKELLPLAEQGNASAQVSLGLMYHEGRGVAQDYSEAARWYRLAAEQGSADAQLNLGVMYGQGQGVAQDYIHAHIWFNLAGASGNADGIKYRNTVARKMTPDQIAEAQRLAREWKPTIGVPR